MRGFYRCLNVHEVVDSSYDRLHGNISGIVFRDENDNIISVEHSCLWFGKIYDLHSAVISSSFRCTFYSIQADNYNYCM